MPRTFLIYAVALLVLVPAPPATADRLHDPAFAAPDDHLLLGANVVDFSSFPLDPPAATRASEAARRLSPDGGGGAFLLATEIVEGGGLRIHALRAADGKPVWTTPAMDAADVGAWATVGDLNGDAVPDVLVRLLWLGVASQRQECHGPVCGSRDSFPWEWSLGALSGVDGRWLWEQKVTGGHDRVSLASSGLPLPIQHHFGGSVSRELALDVEIVGDATGDGRPDVIVNAATVVYTRAEAKVGSATPGPGVQTITGRAWVIDGATGTTAFALAAASASNAQRPVLHGAGIADGDRASDLVWAEPGLTHTTLTMLSGGSFLPLWTKAIPGTDGVTRVAAPLLADLTGDGRDDLLVHSLGPGPFERTMTLLSGASGAAAWENVPGGPLVFVLRAADDAHLAQVRSRLTGDGFEVTTERLDAATGRPSHTDRILIPPVTGFGFFWINAHPASDFSGSGGEDMLVSIIAAQLSPEASAWTTRSTIRSLDGASMELLGERTFDGVAYAITAADLDPTPGNDLFATVATDAGSLAHAWSPATGQMLWTTALPGYSTWRGSLHDVAGDPRNEVAVSLITPDGPRIQVLDGATGETIWSASGVTALGRT